MISVVIYASRTGNTRKIAEAIADVLGSRGSVHLLAVDDAPMVLTEDADLVVIGGPTEGHGVTEPITRFFDRIGPDALRDRAAAAFDTRLRWPRWLSGSAAAGIAERLRACGARVIAPEESFLVSRKPELEPGELEHAAAWATSLADLVEAGKPALLAGTHR